MDSNNLNPDIVGDINPDGSHTAQFAFSSKAVGGRRRKYKSIRSKIPDFYSLKYNNTI